MNARPRLLLASILLTACASSSPPPATPAPPAPAAAPSTPSSQPAAAPAPQASMSAEVTEVSISDKAKAKVLFSNPTKGACKVLAYTLVWAGNKKTITLGDLTIPAGQTRERWIKVAPDDGDITALTPDAAKVELRADCGG